MVNVLKKMFSVVSLLVLIIADLLLIDRFFFYDNLLVIEPTLFKSLVGKDLESAGILVNLAVSGYNGFIKSISLWPKLFLIIGVFLVTFCIVYEIYVLYNKLEKVRQYFMLKVFANSISITVIVFYYNLFIIKTTKISNDVVANFIFFKVIIKKDIEEKKNIFFDTLFELIDKSNKLLPVDKELLKNKFGNKLDSFAWLSDEYVDVCSSKTIYETATKIGNNLINDVIKNYKPISSNVSSTAINVNASEILSKISSAILSSAQFLLSNAGPLLIIGATSFGGYLQFKGYFNNHAAIQKLFKFSEEAAKDTEILNKAGKVATEGVSAIAETVKTGTQTVNELTNMVNILKDGVANQIIVSTELTNRIIDLTGRVVQLEGNLAETAIALGAAINQIQLLQAPLVQQAFEIAKAVP